MKNILNKKISVKSLLVFVLVVAVATLSVAATPTQIRATLSPDVSVMLNGELQTVRDVNGNIVYPVIYNDSTYLPVRGISNLLDVGIDWDPAARAVLLTSKGQDQSSDKTIPGEGGEVRVSEVTRFKFVPNTSGMWVFSTSENGNSDPVLTLYDSRGATLSYNDDADEDLNAMIVYSLTAGTAYTIEAGFFGTIGSYKLTVEQVTILPTSGNTNIRGDTMFSFTPNRTGLWTLQTSDNGLSDPYIIIDEPGGGFFATDDDSAGGLNALLSVFLVEGRSYIVYVGFISSSESCRLSVSSTAPTTVPASGGTFNVNGDTVYVFTPGSAGFWDIRTSNSGDFDPFLYLFDSSGDFLDDDDDGAGGLNALISTHLNAGSTYYILATSYDDGAHVYTLTVAPK